MDNSTSFGNPSCVLENTRLAHLKCSLANIINGYGDMVMGMGRFRQGVDINDPANCDMRTKACNDCRTNPAQCQPEMSSGDRFEVLVPILEGNQNDLLKWVDFSANTCYPDNAMDPELVSSGATPIGGALKGAKLYWQGEPTPGIDTNVGVVPYWVGPGDDPIRDDPLKTAVDVSTGYQCRPYITIMMTDGDETCTSDFQDTVNAAASLLTTTVDGQDFHIEVKALGLGKAPGDPEIEALAHAGGAVDVPGVNEGFYAQNEDELSLAISQIISSAIKFETCNGLDDDCDNNIDEAFPAKGTACDDGEYGVCRDIGSLVCSADGSGVECDAIDDDDNNAPPLPEECNGLDDDCDNKIDEGSVCSGCTTEVCDGTDNDCDTRVDEDLVRGCGSDVGECQAGTETCNNGNWEGCTAVGGGAEVCDFLDNDCDGISDGIVEQCAVIPGNNPGVGICTYGTRVCAEGSGMYGPCLGEQGPVTEICDLLDNDCDGILDESTGGAPCQGSCGIGVTQCVNGAIECANTVPTGDEVCDNGDNDCDGKIDENVATNGPCSVDDAGNTLCTPGTLTCLGGSYQCVGGVPSSQDLCDCEDNDCDGVTDEAGDALCPGGSSCVSCQCAFPCSPGEFPCPFGQYCANVDGQNVCLYDPCYDVVCDPDNNGDVYQCVDGECVRSCDLVNCPAGQVCVGSTGQCAPDNCHTFPDRCDATQTCHTGECVPNPCAGVDCPEGEYCAAGNCYASCTDVVCPRGERCELGECVPDACNGPCGRNEFCDETEGECLVDRCSDDACPAGQDCNPATGTCRPDPCLGVVCPTEGEVCREGSCYPPFLPDAGPTHDFVTAVGGGCCSAADSGPGSGTILLMLLVFLGINRRRSASSETDHA